MSLDLPLLNFIIEQCFAGLPYVRVRIGSARVLRKGLTAEIAGRRQCIMTRYQVSAESKLSLKMLEEKKRGGH